MNVDWSRILSEFARLLKELRIGEEEGICTIPSKFMLHCNCSKIASRYLSDHLTLRLLSPVNRLESIYSQLEKVSVSRPKILISNEAKENANDFRRASVRIMAKSSTSGAHYRFA